MKSNRRAFLAMTSAAGLATGDSLTTSTETGETMQITSNDSIITSSSVDDIQQLDTVEVSTENSPIVLTTSIGQSKDADATLEKLSAQAVIDEDRDGIGETVIPLAPTVPESVEVSTITPSGIAFGNFSDAVIQLQTGTQTRSGDPTDIVYSYSISDEEGQVASSEGVQRAEPDRPGAFISDFGSESIASSSPSAKLGNPQRIDQPHDAYTVLASAAVAEGSSVDLSELRIDLSVDGEDQYTIVQGSTASNPAREQNGVEATRTLFADLYESDIQLNALFSREDEAFDLTWTLVVFGVDF